MRYRLRARAPAAAQVLLADPIPSVPSPPRSPASGRAADRHKLPRCGPSTTCASSVCGSTTKISASSGPYTLITARAKVASAVDIPHSGSPASSRCGAAAKSASAGRSPTSEIPNGTLAPPIAPMPRLPEHLAQRDPLGQNLQLGRRPTVTGTCGSRRPRPRHAPPAHPPPPAATPSGSDSQPWMYPGHGSTPSGSARPPRARRLPNHPVPQHHRRGLLAGPKGTFLATCRLLVLKSSVVIAQLELHVARQQRLHPRAQSCPESTHWPTRSRAHRDWGPSS